MLILFVDLAKYSTKAVAVVAAACSSYFVRLVVVLTVDSEILLVFCPEVAMGS